MSYSNAARRGTAGYENSGDWTWQHFPPPFDKWAPADSVAQPAPILGRGGLGCASCGGGCGDPQNQGLGQTSTGIFGTGLFAGGLNPSTWGVGEWAVVAVGGYAAVQVVSSHPTAGKVSKRAKKAATAGTMGLGTIVVYGAAAYAAWWVYNQYQTTGGLGDYQQQAFVNPQILGDPTKTSQIHLPVGW